METPKLASLYQELILDHYRRPRNKGELDEATVEVALANPVCGDEIRLQLRVADDTIEEARFTGQGCSISQAAASMMTQKLEGTSVDQAGALADRFTEMMHGSESAAKDRALGDLRALAGVSRFPVRVKCALLGFEALLESLKAVGPDAARTPGAPPGAPTDEADG